MLDADIILRDFDRIRYRIFSNNLADTLNRLQMLLSFITIYKDKMTGTSPIAHLQGIPMKSIRFTSNGKIQSGLREGEHHHTQAGGKLFFQSARC